MTGISNFLIRSMTSLQVSNMNWRCWVVEFWSSLRSWPDEKTGPSAARMMTLFGGAERVVKECLSCCKTSRERTLRFLGFERVRVEMGPFVLIVRGVGEVEEETWELAEIVAGSSGDAVRLGKKAFYRQMKEHIGVAYEIAGKVMVDNLEYADAKEGISAFLEKREPKWTS